MVTLYNKTSLNKIKRVDLVQMFLDQQAQLKHCKIGFERVCNGLKSLQEENDKLKEQLQDAPEEGSWVTCDYQESREKNLNDKIKELEADLEWNKHEVLRYSVALEEEYILIDEYEKLKEEKYSLYLKWSDQKEENEKLKEKNDYAYKQLNELMSKATLLKDEIESKEESDSESEEEEDECVCCGTNFDQHEARYNQGEDLRLKYQKYFGSENDDGDICPECLNKIY